MRGLVSDVVDELHALDARVKQLDCEFKVLSEADESARLLRTVPSIGAINATALAAAVGDASARRVATLPPGWASFRAR